LRLIILHFSQRGFTEARTFIFSVSFQVPAASCRAYFPFRTLYLLTVSHFISIADSQQLYHEPVWPGKLWGLDFSGNFAAGPLLPGCDAYL
jgi:hypothetical protein